MGGDTLVHEARVFNGLLNAYTRDFGKAINWKNSLVYFTNTPLERKGKIAYILGSGIGTLPATYLGFTLGNIPLDSFWNSIIDRFKKKLVG